MSPVGSFESLMAAIQAGAGSVYFGVGKLNMRSRSSVNFTLDDLGTIAGICREKGVKTYLTLNTVIFDHELEELKATVDRAKKEGITAIIASDMAVIQYCRTAGMEIHLSTQTNITNIEAVKYYAQFADVIVTARELELKQVAAICDAIQQDSITGPAGKPVRIEVFVHGALCMAVSGKCYISLDNYGYSANRGACLQPCRKAYTVKDKETDLELEVDHEYIMSPKDLKTLHFLDKIIAAGVTVLKIEGRGRSPEYVKTVTRCYHEAVEAVLEGTFTPDKVTEWEKQLGGVYNRGFWDGYYLGKKLGEWTEVYGSQATKRKIYVGKVTNFFTKLSVAEIKIETNDLVKGDEIVIVGPTTGVYEDIVSELRLDTGDVAEMADKGELCSVTVKSLVRRGDKVYKMVEAAKVDGAWLQ
ncbi:MAG: peptidase U32 family protein [Bacteroidales bacterium]